MDGVPLILTLYTAPSYFLYCKATGAVMSKLSPAISGRVRKTRDMVVSLRTTSSLAMMLTFSPPSSEPWWFSISKFRE